MAIARRVSVVSVSLLLLARPAYADDAELFLIDADLTASPEPDSSFFLDASESATSAQAVQESYDSNQLYAGPCDNDLIYWTDIDVTPDCSTTNNIIDKRDFLCDSAARQLSTRGGSRYMLAQYRNGGTDGRSIGPYRWQFLAPGHANSPVECLADHGIHGDGRSDYRWPSAGTNVSDPYTRIQQNALPWGSTPRNRSYTIYDGNYLNWKHSRGDNVLIRSEVIEAVSRDDPAIIDDLPADSRSPSSCGTNTPLSFTKPIVAVNSFNRTQHLNDVYLSSFGVRQKTHWPGQLKKHRIANQRIDDSSDLWAAVRTVAAPASRNLYSNIVSNDLSADGNAVTSANSALRPSDFGLTGAAEEPSLEKLVDWARGLDYQGDSLHSQPAAVVYGGSADDPDTVIYTATNDGYLHAISGRDGRELWAFIPEQLLANLTRLYRDPDTNYKHYGLDGNVVPVIKDVDQDGTIEADDGDFVFLVLGMRRGGQTYFALDVTDKNAPTLLWIFDSKESGESWSTPSISRMHIAGSLQNEEKAVVVIGGGYDTVHDAQAHPAGADGTGAGIHVLDLVSGERLWRAGMDAGANLSLNVMGREMDRAIPNQIRVIDLNGDGLADRLYASDLGGQIWRFDVRNGNSANDLVSGGVIAQLGADGSRTRPLAAENRRFYNSPDVSLITDSAQQKRYLAISIGSGYRAHPFDLSASDRFFSIRDPDVFKPLTQQEYDSYPIVTTQDLVEVNGQTRSTISSSDRGWMLSLPANEKILTDSLTFDDQVFFVAFTPDSDDAGDCASRFGKNHLYRLNILNGDSVPSPTSSRGRSEKLQQIGIAPSPTVLFPGPDVDCIGDECNIRPLACIGAECFNPDLDSMPVRTLWTQDGIN